MTLTTYILLIEAEPDVMDVMLRGLSGFAVLTHIHQQSPARPVIGISANPQAIAQLAAQPVRHYLLKPFHIEELLDMVAHAGLRPAAR